MDILSNNGSTFEASDVIVEIYKQENFLYKYGMCQSPQNTAVS